MDTPDYLEINKKLWDSKTKHHLASDFYNMPAFLQGRSSLNDIELDLLGNVAGKSILHLQCHFGQDTLSLARMGATVTGIDLSGEAIKAAQEIAGTLGLGATFICCNIYDLPQYLNRQFDIVYTSYGVIGWLPDMAAWAQIVARFLKPGGSFVMAEFHPVVWMFDDAFTNVKYSYFNKEAIEEVESGSYADRSINEQFAYIGWNHDLAEVLQSLQSAGLSLTSFREYDYSPYNIFLNPVEIEQGKYNVKGMEGKLPMVYGLKMVKP